MDEDCEAIPEDLLRLKEAAHLLRRSEWTLHDWKKRKVGPRPLKIGGLNMYSSKELNRWVHDGARLEPWAS